MSSVSHDNWFNRAIVQLYEKRANLTIPNGDKLIVELLFYSSTARGEDLDNKANSIMDLLVKAKIIPDDNWNIVPKLILEYGGKDKENPRCEITIYEQIGREAQQTPQTV
jgi:Holliday junction resolvase RusA-like endonuclease